MPVSASRASAFAVASTIADEAEAAPLYVEANNAIKALVPMVPIAHGASASAALNTLENAHFRPFGAPLFARVNPGKDTMVFMQNAEPISLYCTDETDGESLSACQQVVEPLLGYAIDSGAVEPRLATGCTANDDASVRAAVCPMCLGRCSLSTGACSRRPARSCGYPPFACPAGARRS